MRNLNCIKIIVTVTVLALTIAVKAQTVIGSWQNDSGDGWINFQNGLSITNPANTNEFQFVQNAVAGYPQSLEINHAGYQQTLAVDVGTLPNGKAEFLANHQFSFTVSFPASGGQYTAGYSQIYAVTFETAAGAVSIPWTNFTGNAGSMPGVGYYSSFPGQSITVTWDYSSYLTNATATNGNQFEFVFASNNGGGAPTNIYMNNVTLSGAPAANVFVVDNFSTNGVSPLNPTNDDYYTTTNVYELGEITNVWANWFGGAYSGVLWSTNSTGTNPAFGSLQINLNWAAGSQFVVWEQGPANDDYSIPNVSSLTYTSLEMDVKWDASSVAFLGAQTYTNYGPLRFGERDYAYGQDWLLTTNIPVGDTNWIHVVVPLTAGNPLQNGQSGTFDGVLIGADSGSFANSQFVGPATLYVDNIEFKGAVATTQTPGPTLSIQPATPGLRIYAGSTVNTYDRADLVTVDENMSWVNGPFPVTYSFSLLSYPINNINQTMLELIPVNSLNGTATYGTEYGDYEAGDGLWLVLAPNGGGAVTATVEWKTNDFAANPAVTGPNTNYDNPSFMSLQITNPTAIGRWTLSFNSATTGSLTPPGGTAHNFTIADPTAATDFANPVIAQFGLQPNSTAGEGLYETWGFIGITNIQDGNEYEDFTHESSDLTLSPMTSYDVTPSGYFETANSANQNCGIIILPGTDRYWVTWTTPAVGYNLVTGTNLLLSPATHWVTPDYFSSGNDSTAPRGVPVLEGPTEVEVIPADNSPTANGQVGGPLSPNAFFLLTTNTPATSP